MITAHIIIFNAAFSSGGTHLRWVNDTILALRKMVALNDGPMRISVKADETCRLDVCWRRLAPGGFVYPEGEESSMPARYEELWEATVAYPAHIIGRGPQDGPQEEE